MKVFISTIILFIFFTSCKPKQEQSSDINKIKIVYVNRGIYSLIPGSCENFEKSLSQLIQTIFIEDDYTLSKIKMCLDEMTLTNEKDIDVKIKVYLMQGNRIVSIICLDQFDGIVTNGKVYKNESFTLLINEIIDKN